MPKLFKLTLTVYFLVACQLVFAQTCLEFYRGTLIPEMIAFSDHAREITALLKEPFYKRLISNRQIRALAKNLIFEIPIGDLAIDKQESLILAVAALESGNKKAYEIILEETRMTIDSKQAYEVSLKDFFGEELVELFKIKPTLIFQWRYLKNLGRWETGNTILGNYKVWQSTLDTQYGRVHFSINPMKNGPTGFSASVKHNELGIYPQVRALVDEALKITQDQINSSIPRTVYETRQYEGNEFGGTAIQLANFKGREDRGENLLIFSANFKRLLHLGRPNHQ